MRSVCLFPGGEKFLGNFIGISQNLEMTLESTDIFDDIEPFSPRTRDVSLFVQVTIVFYRGALDECFSYEFYTLLFKLISKYCIFFIVIVNRIFSTISPLNFNQCF